MFRLSLRTIFGHKRRLVSTVIAIVLGVSFLTGTLVFTDSLSRQFDDLFGSVYARTDVVVRSAESIDIGQGISQRGRISDQLVTAVAAVPGVAAAAGTVGGYARILATDGTPLGTDQGMPNFGMDIGAGDLSVWTTRLGRLPTGPGEMGIDAGAFEEGGFALGQLVTVLSQQGSSTFTLVGVFGFGSADSPAGSRVALFDLATAQSFVGQTGSIDTVVAKGDGTLSQQELATRVAATMPSGTETLTGKAMAADSSNQVKTSLGFLKTMLLVFAAVALFVGSFIVYNTFSIMVAQRKREDALLRAIGASERQVETALLGEAVILGLVGSMVGIAAGFGAALGLRAFLALFGADLPGGGLLLLPRTIVVGFVVGMVITMASAVLPARRGGKVPPIAALRDVAVEQRAFSPTRLVAGLGLLAVSVTLVAIGLTGRLALVGLGVALVFISLFVLGPLLARPVSAFLGAPFARFWGTSGVLARQNAERNPKRTARTAAALLVGVSLVVAITVFASSVKSSIRSIIGEQFTGDYVVSTQATGFGGLPTTLATDIGQVPGVAAAAGVQLVFMDVNGSATISSAVDPATAGKVFDVGMVSGSIESLDDSSVLLSKKRAEKDNVAVGDVLTVTFLDGAAHPLKVVGIYEKDQLAGAYTIAKSLYALSGADQYDFSIFVKLDKGSSASAVERRLQAAVAPYPTATLESRDAYVESQAKQVDMFVNLVYGLLALAVLIAVFGIANTLSLSVYERERELGLLRAVGATRRQVRSMVRIESVITAVLGTVQGIVVGVALGWAVVMALRSEGFSEFSVPVGTMVGVLLLSIVCGVVAATRPARRASRLNILDAIASE